MEEPGDKLKHKRSRLATLQADRQGFLDHWKQLSEYLLPEGGRYLTSGRGRGERQYASIYDNTATIAVRDLGAGMLSNASSPAKPFFDLGIEGPDSEDTQETKVWLRTVRDLCLDVLAGSNSYRVFQQLFEDLGVFGTAGSVILPDEENVIHHYPMDAGEFCIAHNHKGVVDTLYREFDMTVAQLVQQFGLEKCSLHVRNRYDRKGFDEPVTVVHAIEPRIGRDPSKVDNLNMPWSSCYFELTAPAGSGMLSESGYNYFPAIVPRWSVRGGDTYGRSPGMIALGDVKGLQLAQKRLAQVVDFRTRPPTILPTSMRNQPVDFMPGGQTYGDPLSPAAAVRPAWEVTLDPDSINSVILDHQTRIRRAFFTDLFLMISNNGPDTNMTRAEVIIRNEEKFTMLGPVAARLDNEMFSPVINIIFQQLLERGDLPEPPEEIAGAGLKIEFTSALAQAQKAMGISASDRFMAHIAGAAQLKPEVLDVWDADQDVSDYASQLGINPETIVDLTKVAELRTARAKAQAAAAQSEAMEKQSATLKNLGAVPTGGAPNAASDLLRGAPR